MKLRRVPPEEAGWGETMVGPWTRRRRSVAYQNPWMVVWHDEVTRPDGVPGIYGVVHFRNSAVGVVAIDDEDRVALVGQHRYAFDAYHWEIPEGGSPHEEDSLEGARRELFEETGLTARTWREIGRWELSNSVTDEAAVAYLATDLVEGAADPGPRGAAGVPLAALRRGRGHDRSRRDHRCADGPAHAGSGPAARTRPLRLTPVRGVRYCPSPHDQVLVL